MTNTMKLGRRRMLQGLGLGAAGLSFLRSLPSVAAPEQAPRRLVIFFSPNEPAHREEWLPPGQGDEFALTSLQGVMSALEPLRSKLLMIGGVEMKSVVDEGIGEGHVGIGHLLTGRRVNGLGEGNAAFWATGPSIDQEVARHLGCDPLTLGALCGGSNGNNRISYRGANQPVDPIQDPAVAFEALFGLADLSEQELAKLRAQKRSVLDAVTGDLERLRGRVAAADRIKMEAHLDGVRALEQKLDAPVNACNPPTPAGIPGGLVNANYPAIASAQIDVLVQALACNTTRVASLQLGNSGAGNHTPDWPGIGISDENEHEVCHTFWSARKNRQNNPAAYQHARERRLALERFYYDRFAELLTKMDAVPEGDGTMLDHSLVLYCKNLAYNHASDDMLFMIAGSGGNLVQTGRYIERAGVAHNDLLVTLGNLMGMNDLDSFGDPQFCAGPMAL